MSEKKEKIRKLLKPFYEEYIQIVSTPDMAISLETACFLFIFSDLISASKILDLGSGFSSFVFSLLSS